MTAASPGPHLFSSILNENDSGKQRETFLLSLFAQGAILALIILLTGWVIRGAPTLTRRGPDLGESPLIYSGHFGGGGGNHDPFPASHGNLPRASLDPQIVPPTVVVPKEMPRLPAEQTVEVAPDVKMPQGGQIGDPTSQLARLLSNGPGGPHGIGTGCCDGVGSWSGPHVGNGPPGVFPAGKQGVTVPQVIFNPEPSFSDEARKSKTQGVVTLMLVVGKDGHPYDIRVRQSLGMGLDEKAIEAVNRWRFRPATLDGQAVATQIAVELQFRLY